MRYAYRWSIVTSAVVGIILGWAIHLLMAAPRQAPSVVFVLEPARSQVEFTLGAFLHTVHGTFRVKRGQLRLDLASGAVSGECVVDATSGDTDNDKRDQKMHTEVLASARYPDIVFSVQQMQGQVALPGVSTVVLEGVLRLHNVAHPLSTTAHVQVQDDAFTFATHFRIPYVEWGLPDPSTFILTVEKQVAITFEAAGYLRRETSE